MKTKRIFALLLTTLIVMSLFATATLAQPVEISLAKDGPGTTNPAPGIYYLDVDDPYTFRAHAYKSPEPEEYFYKFNRWEVDDGVEVTEVSDPVLSDVASTNLAVTAVFETRYIMSCSIIYEDGLEDEYMWRDPHVLLTIKPTGTSHVTVTIESDYGTYSRTVLTYVKSLNFYFKPFWFVGDYTVVVTATNDLGPYAPRVILAGLD